MLRICPKPRDGAKTHLAFMEPKIEARGRLYTRDMAAAIEMRSAEGAGLCLLKRSHNATRTNNPHMDSFWLGSAGEEKSTGDNLLREDSSRWAVNVLIILPTGQRQVCEMVLRSDTEYRC